MRTMGMIDVRQFIEDSEKLCETLDERRKSKILVPYKRKVQNLDLFLKRMNTGLDNFTDEEPKRGYDGFDDPYSVDEYYYEEDDKDICIKIDEPVYEESKTLEIKVEEIPRLKKFLSEANKKLTKITEEYNKLEQNLKETISFEKLPHPWGQAFISNDAYIVVPAKNKYAVIVAEHTALKSNTKKSKTNFKVEENLLFETIHEAKILFANIFKVRLLAKNTEDLPFIETSYPIITKKFEEYKLEFKSRLLKN